jgi:hypothetical protein
LKRLWNLRGSFSEGVLIKTQGDVYTVWKPLNEILGSHNARTTITLNLHNRRTRRVAHGALELLVEASSTHVDWRLKVGGVNITREFKPSFALEIPELNRYFFKFVYDITGLLNTDEATSREWVNIIIKHNGGDQLSLKGLLLNVIYEDSEASSIYSYATGLLLVERGDEFTYNLNSAFQNRSNIHTKLILYAPRATRARIAYGGSVETLTLQHNQAEEYSVLSGRFTPQIKLLLEEDAQSYVVLSSITTYTVDLKVPRLELDGVEALRRGSDVKIKVRVVNVGESVPDRVVISVFNRGFLVGTVRCDHTKYKPGELVEEELVIPIQQQPSELTVRVAWSKLTRTEFIDRKVTLT